jgi:hypothetical protein
MIKRKLLAMAVGAGIGCGGASAVSLDGDGIGQALIYPYYTVQNSGTDSWNTYLSVVNRQDKAKALRVRFREGRNGREVGGFNLFLAPQDVWTGVVVPVASTDVSGAKVLTADESCTDPVVQPQGNFFSSTSYSGASSDGLGTGLDRTREGYVEIIEMATLTGASAAAVTFGSSGRPTNCEFVRAQGLASATLEPPSGGLSGTLTLLNVNSGMDMGVNAVALADLASTPFYRNYDDPYPDFNAAEVTAVSHVVADGVSHVLKWSRGVDAVSSVLMATDVMNEYVRDTVTASSTDWVLTFPTARFYADGEPPFGRVRDEQEGFNVDFRWFNRESRGSGYGGACGFTAGPCVPPARTKGASVVALGLVPDPLLPMESLLGSRNVDPAFDGAITTTFQSGWARLAFSPGDFNLTSQPGSVARVHVNGATFASQFRVAGLPVVGLAVRTFKNGTLQCAGAFGSPGSKACQGNYGGAFPHRYRRLVEPVAP